MWFVYVVRCADNSLYTGITTDVGRRINEHNTSNKIGSKYTRVKRPVILVYKEKIASRSKALKRETEIKRMSHQQKEDLATI